jgi:ribonuclease-3 family protein
METKSIDNSAELPALTLAYIGVAVYELWVRSYLIRQGLVRADDLHKAAVRFVQAKGQAALIKKLLPELNEEEQAVFQRGRNAKGQYPRQCDVQEYRYATGFEALVGHLYMTDQQERLDKVLDRTEDILLTMQAN